MKKLLNKLTIFTVITSASSFIVACKDEKTDSKKDIFKSANKQDEKKTSENKQIESNSDNILNKVKEYIDKELHHVGTQAFDEYISINPERHFFANQHYKNVVDVVNKYVKLFCKKEKLTFVEVELDEENVLLEEMDNVINIKIVLNNQVIKTNITLKNVKKASENKQIESNPDNILLNKVKEYIDKKLHHVGTQAFDHYALIEPDRQFFTNQHYKDVVDVINKYIKLFCKKERITTLANIELDEPDAPLVEKDNVIYIKSVLNDQVIKTSVTLEKVKKANTEEQKANLLATKLTNETHNFTYNEFNESNTVNDIANKIKQIYQKDLVVNHFNNIVFDQDNGKILPSANLKWGENIIPLVVEYNRKPTKINLKINLINQQQFPEYEVNRVINKILLNSETTNSIFGVTANIEQPIDKVLLGYYYYDTLINRINNFLDGKSDVEVKRSALQEIDRKIVKTFPFNVTFVVSLNDYNKEVEITITR